MNFNYFCRLGFVFILLATTAQHTLFSMDTPSSGEKEEERILLDRYLPVEVEPLETTPFFTRKPARVWPSMCFNPQDAFYAQLFTLEHVKKTTTSRRATSSAVKNFCTVVLPSCAAIEALLDKCHTSTPEELAIFRKIIAPLFDETGEPDIGPWREIVYHLKGLPGHAPLHATQHILYQLRDQYTPALIAVCSANSTTVTTTSAQGYLQTLNPQQLELFVAIRNGLVAGFETFDVVKKAQVQDMLNAQSPKAIEALEIKLGESWMEDIRKRALDHARIQMLVKENKSPLSKSSSSGSFSEIEEKSYAPELRFTFSHATPTVSFAVKFFKNFFLHNCEKIQLIHYNPTTPKIVLRGKIKGDTWHRWVYVKILGKAKSTNCGPAEREARGHGYYLGWVNPNHGHLVINFEVKTAANTTEAAKEFPEEMELQANGHMLVAFPDNRDLLDAMQELASIAQYQAQIVPTTFSEGRFAGIPPLKNVEEITSLIKKWKKQITSYKSVATSLRHSGNVAAADELNPLIQENEELLKAFETREKSFTDEADLFQIWGELNLAVTAFNERATALRNSSPASEGSVLSPTTLEEKINGLLIKWESALTIQRKQWQEWEKLEPTEPIIESFEKLMDESQAFLDTYKARRAATSEVEFSDLLKDLTERAKYFTQGPQVIAFFKALPTEIKKACKKA